jgi:polyphosphate kinase
VLTPVRAAPGGPFPPTGNLRVHVAFRLRDESGSDEIAVVQVPANLDRFVRVPSNEPGLLLAPLETVIGAWGHLMFEGRSIVERLSFKATRDADLGVDEDRRDDFVEAMEEVLAGRESSRPVRMTFSGRDGPLARDIAAALGLADRDVYALKGPVDLGRFMQVVDLAGFDGLRAPPRTSFRTLVFSEDNEPWHAIRERDIVLHHPYESFEPVESFVRMAAADPDVLAIKMTLYRTSGDSPIVRALGHAAREGKQVTAVVELKARFDEERNMGWASRLERAGAIVTYGAARLKVHAKACLVVRRESDGGVRRYAHVSTGNYNDHTARLYSDISLFTCDERVCRDLAAFFNVLTGCSSLKGTECVAVAPFNLKQRLLELVNREASRSLPGRPGAITAKMNALVDLDVVEALYRASKAGARIRLNVRGTCVLKPGVPGLSENVEVRSIVGSELEHARVFAFGRKGEEDVFVSSSDWMPRNLERRVELMTPVFDPDARERLLAILRECFEDTAKARVLDADGTWHKVRPREGEAPFNAQDEFARRAEELARRDAATERDSGELVVRKKPRRKQ